MIGLGKLLENKKETIGLGRVLLEQEECYAEDFFTVDDEVLEPGVDDNAMLVKVKEACSQGDSCASTYFEYYKNNRSNIQKPSECDFSVEGQEDEPVDTWACKDDGAESEEELVTWAYDNGWMTKSNAEKESITDTEADPNVTYEDGLSSEEANDDDLDWSDWRRFFKKKDFYNDTVEGSEKCKMISLYKKKEVEDELVLPEPEYATLESFCDDNALLKAGDGSWTGFYKFKYKDGLETCLVDNWTYVSAMGISYGTGEDRCWDYVRVPRSMPVPGATYNMPVKLSFYRVNAGCVTGKWKSQQMIVDPDKNFGGKKRVQGQNQSLNPSRVFDRKNYNPYGSGQSSPNTSGGDPYASARDRLAYNPEAFEYIDDGEEVVTTSRTTNNPLRGYGGLIDDIFA